MAAYFKHVGTQQMEMPAFSRMWAGVAEFLLQTYFLCGLFGAHRIWWAWLHCPSAIEQKEMPAILEMCVPLWNASTK